MGDPQIHVASQAAAELIKGAGDNARHLLPLIIFIHQLIQACLCSIHN